MDENAVKKSWPWGNTPPARRVKIIKKNIERIAEQVRIEQARFAATLDHFTKMEAAERADLELAEQFEEEEIRRNNIELAAQLLETFGVDRLEYASSSVKVRDRREILKRAISKALDGKLPNAISAEEATANIQSTEDAEIEALLTSLKIPDLPLDP